MEQALHPPSHVIFAEAIDAGEQGAVFISFDAGQHARAKGGEDMVVEATAALGQMHLADVCRFIGQKIVYRCGDSIAISFLHKACSLGACCGSIPFSSILRSSNTLSRASLSDTAGYLPSDISGRASPKR